MLYCIIEQIFRMGKAEEDVKKFITLLLLFSLSGCSGVASVRSEPLAEKIATRLQVPWSIAKDGDTFFISERPGTIVKVTPNGTSVREELQLSAPLSTVAEAGLLGFVLKDDFSKSKEAYAYYTYDRDGTPLNRIVLLRYDGGSWSETAILLDDVPSGPIHHGGRLALSPNGVLFATIGDGANPNAAQDIHSLNGKIIFLGDDGIFDIFSIGHRNPQGLAWDENGVMYESEHGQSANDEINVIEKGNNYGWPVIEGTESKAGMETPFLTSGPNETWAPSGMSFHDGLLYFAALRGQGILVIDPVKGKIIDKIKGYGRVRDVYSDGEFLYFITNNTDGRGNVKENDDVLYRLKRR